MNQVLRSKTILTDIQMVCQNEGFLIFGERESDSMVSFNSRIDNFTGLEKIVVNFTLNTDIAEVSIYFKDTIRPEKMPVLWELFNAINLFQCTSRWVTDPEIMQIVHRTALIIPGDTLDKAQFQMALKRFIILGQKFYPLIKNQLHSYSDPFEVIYKFEEENEYLSLYDE